MNRTPAYEGKNNYLFVSYAHKDSEQVLPMIRRMYEEKYRVWYDQGIVPGSEWPHNIEVHLKGCSTVLTFTSKNSLASPNCENEVVNAIRNKKKIIQYSLDGSVHPLLGSDVVDTPDELMNRLGDDLIGDGTGYEIKQSNKRRLSFWNVLLGFSFILIIALIGAIYGFEQGYFDKYLPSRDTSEEEIITVKPEEKVEIDNDIFAQAILAQLSEEDLFREIEITDDDRIVLCDALNLDKNKKLTYYDLTKIADQDVTISDCSEKCLSLLKYLPQLRRLQIDSTNIDSLESLNECAKLEEVTISERSFPIKIESERRFKIIYTK